MPRQFTFGKDERLKSRKLIEQLFSSGQRFGLFPYRIFYLFDTEKNPLQKNKLQCGVGVSTRNFKKAVDRNRIKRLTREAWRLQKPLLNNQMKNHPHALRVFLIYTGKELPAFAVVKEKMTAITDKLIMIANENIAANT